MLTTNLEPVYGIILAYAILGDSEQMTLEFYIGAVVILLVIIGNGIIKTRMDKKAKKELEA
jgi:drug/metabolite transporter (DMT)-like permease